MSQHEVVRTLVRSAPELWEVCSDPDSLGRHLQAFGEIRITRVEPETTVAWEGERVSGTVQIEPSGWGTRVTLTARAEQAIELVTETVPAGQEVPADPAGPAVAMAEPTDPGRAPVPAPVDPGRVPDPAPVDSGRAPDPAPVDPGRACEPEPVDPGPVSKPAPVDQLEVGAEATPVPPEAAPAPRRGLFKRLGRMFFSSFVTPVEVAEDAFGAREGQDPPPDPVSEPAPAVAAEQPEAGGAPVVAATVPAPPPPPSLTEPDSPPHPVVDAPSALAQALDSLGSDHHRPFSRS